MLAIHIVTTNYIFSIAKQLLYQLAIVVNMQCNSIIYNCGMHVYIIFIVIIFIYAYKVQDMAERSSDEYVGSFLSQKGITSAMLLSHDSAELTSVGVSNGVILDL